MSPTTPRIPKALVDRILEGRCVLFAGAGLSMQAGLPNWTGLLRGLVSAVEEYSPGAGGDEIEKLFKKNKLLAIAEFCRKELGELAYAEAIASQTRPTGGELSEAHQWASKIPFAAAVTTNYDHLLRDAFSANRGVPRTLTHLDTHVLAQLLFGGGFFILNAHGDIDRPESIVLTRLDFQELIHANPAFQAAFSALLLTKAILFVGYSFSDPDFQLLLERSLTLFRKFGPDRFALMNDVDAIEAEVMYRSAGIRVLSYSPSAPNHPEVPAFLRDLAEKCRPEPGIRMMVEAERDEDFPRSHRPSRPVLRLDELLGEEERKELGVDPEKLRQLLGRSLSTRYSAPLSSRGSKLPGHADPDPQPEPGTIGAEPVRLPPIGPTHPATSIGAPEVAEATSPTASYRLSVESSPGKLSWVLDGPQGPESYVSVAPRWAKVQASLRTHQHSDSAAQLVDDDFSGFLRTAPPGEKLTLALSPSIEQYPWEWVEVEGEPLCLRYLLTRAPVGVSDAARGLPGLTGEISLLVIGDPTDILPGARREAETVARLWAERPGTYVKELYSTEASVDRVTAELLSGAYDVVHFAGHAWADAEGAYLRLARNEQLRSDTMRSLLSPRPPALLFLNSHYTAFIPAGVELPPDDKQGTTRLPASGSGHSGFTEAASVSGVASFVGCLGSPLDEGAADLAIQVHQRLIVGHPLSQALLDSRKRLFKRHPENRDWSYFVLSGQGDLVIPFPP